MFKRLVSAGLVFGMAATAPPAAAQAICASRVFITTQLETMFSEHLQASGLQDSLTIVEFWASPESGSWTVLLTWPDGTSCVAASGDAWAEYPPPPPRSDVTG